MDEETKEKIKDKYLEADNWLQIHWKELIWALVFLFIFFGWILDDSYDFDPYDSNIPQHMR